MNSMPVRLSELMPWGRFCALTIGSERDVPIRVPGLQTGHIVRIGEALVMHPKTFQHFKQMIAGLTEVPAAPGLATLLEAVRS